MIVKRPWTPEDEQLYREQVRRELEKLADEVEAQRCSLCGCGGYQHWQECPRGLA